jgi:hypothetical protein
MSTVYKTSAIKRKRRTKAQMAEIKDEIFRAVEEEHPLTCRRLFYRLVSDGVVPKTENAYRNIICRLTADMRREGRLPYNRITDNTRWRMKGSSYSSLEDALRQTHEAYRRSLWASQDAYVEVWTEKDAIASILFDVTNPWDVPLMTARGYASLSFLYSVAQDIKAIGKPAYLYLFGDHDPSGKDARRCIEKTIREFAPRAEVYFELAAVTEEQIEEWGLPTRPTKKSDSRAKKFKGESVEVDAIPPARLRSLAESCITRHINQQRLQRMKRVEQAERQTLAGIIERLNAN